MDHKGHTIQLVIIAIQSSLFYFKQYFISRKWIGQQAYKPIISPLLLLVGLVKHKIYGISKYN